MSAAIHSGALPPLLLTALAIMGSPGPATISLTAAGSAYGVDRSLRYLLGIIVGTWIVLVAVATGITASLLAVPVLRSVLVGASAAYLVWLAFHIATAPTTTEPSAAGDAPTLRGGALLGVANPKAWVAIGAVFASGRLASAAPIDAALKVGVLAAMVVLISSTWLFVGASFGPLLRAPRVGRAVNLLLAAALVVATAFAVLE